MFPFRRLAAIALLSASPFLTGCVASKIRQLKTDKEMLSARIMQLNQDLGAAQETALTEKQRADSAEVDLQALRSAQGSLEARNSELQKKTESAQLALQSTSDSQAKEIGRRIEEALDAEQKMRLQVEELSARADSLAVKVSALESDKALLEKQLETAKAQTDSDTELMKQIRDTLEEQSAEMEKLGKERGDLSTQLEAANQELQLASQKASTLEQKATELETKLGEAGKEQTALKAKAEESEKKANEMAQLVVTPPNTDALRDQLTSDLRASITAGKIRVIATEPGVVRVVLLSDHLFKSASTQLSDEGIQLLAATADSLKATSFKALVLEGHTDNVPVRNMPYPDNWELASARANEVLRWLAGKPGLEAEKLSTQSYSYQRPLETNKTPEGRKANRRVEVRIQL